MFYSGLVSVSFRKLTVSEIIKMCASEKLDAIEWGGDIHVPHGNIKIAREVKEKTFSAGLKISSYGSYYKLGVSSAQGLDFKTVLETAENLGAPIIRVWAGNKSSADCSEKLRSEIIEDAFNAVELAAKSNIAVALEYHCGTLTDSNRSVKLLFDEISHPNLLCYWQPLNDLDFRNRLDGLSGIIDRLSNIHVFHWIKNECAIERRPLSKGESDWLAYLRLISEKSKKNHFALLEFFRNDDTEQFKIDAKTLKRWISTIT